MRWYHVAFLGLVLALPACDDADAPRRPAKIYVCAQSDGRVDVLDGDTLALTTSISMGAQRAPHNVTVTPDGKVLVTNAHLTGEAPDELVLIDPATDTITGRVALDDGAFIAHVVVAPDGGTAYVSAWGANLIYRVDLRTMTRMTSVDMPALRRPHGLRLSADGRRLYSANTENGMVSEIDTATGLVLREFAVPGPAIQVAVGDGVVFASIKSPPAVARIELASGAVTVWPLPQGAPEPAQVMLTPDGQRLLVAEQGNKDLEGNLLDVLDTTSGALLGRVEVGLGAHGIALGPDGRTAYVTAIFEAVVAEVDLDALTVTRRATVNRGPNGIETWRGP